MLNKLLWLGEAVLRNLTRQKEAFDKLKEEQLQQKLNFEKAACK